MKLVLLIGLLVSRTLFLTDTSVLNNEIIIEKLGDLDKDGISEKVIIYNTPDTTEFGRVREIQILKRKDMEWQIWKKSRNTILKSEEGGMMGDPFEGIEIKDGILIIYHSGGSSWKWSLSDKYRFQNNQFKLIGHTLNYGKPCEYLMNCDFNISTGKVILKKDYENCDQEQRIYKTESETFYKKGIALHLDNRNLKKIKIISPKYKEEIYL